MAANVTDRVINCGKVEATTGKTRRYQVPKRPNTPNKTKTRVGRTRSSNPSSGGHSKDVTSLNSVWVEIRRDALGQWRSPATARFHQPQLSVG